jgi:hypothetical protein
MPPDDRLDGASQINARGLVVGTTRFNQRRQLLPLCVGQDAIRACGEIIASMRR